MPADFILQSYMGSSPRAHQHNVVWAGEQPSEISLPRLYQHSPIRLCCCFRLYLPLYFNLTSSQVRPPGTYIPYATHPSCNAPRLLHIRVGITLRLHESELHRLHYFHSGEVVQAPASNGATYHGVSETLPSVQIRCYCSCHTRCCALHASPT